MLPYGKKIIIENFMLFTFEKLFEYSSFQISYVRLSPTMFFFVIDIIFYFDQMFWKIIPENITWSIKIDFEISGENSKIVVELWFQSIHKSIVVTIIFSSCYLIKLNWILWINWYISYWRYFFVSILGAIFLGVEEYSHYSK